MASPAGFTPPGLRTSRCPATLASPEVPGGPMAPRTLGCSSPAPSISPPAATSAFFSTTGVTAAFSCARAISSSTACRFTSGITSAAMNASSGSTSSSSSSIAAASADGGGTVSATAPFCAIKASSGSTSPSSSPSFPLALSCSSSSSSSSSPSSVQPLRLDSPPNSACRCSVSSRCLRRISCHASTRLRRFSISSSKASPCLLASSTPEELGIESCRALFRSRSSSSSAWPRCRL
mmetsp:Transcript_1783/g.6505  ORF Transcript_1783/g.6505 Transcript_1783/m.6505 type:complete len:236 (+) Transcript_1783:3924-4631(+)